MLVLTAAAGNTGWHYMIMRHARYGGVDRTVGVAVVVFFAMIVSHAGESTLPPAISRSYLEGVFIEVNK